MKKTMVAAGILFATTTGLQSAAQADGMNDPYKSREQCVKGKAAAEKKAGK